MGKGVKAEGERVVGEDPRLQQGKDPGVLSGL